MISGDAQDFEAAALTDVNNDFQSPTVIKAHDGPYMVWKTNNAVSMKLNVYGEGSYNDSSTSFLQLNCGTVSFTNDQANAPNNAKIQIGNGASFTDPRALNVYGEIAFQAPATQAYTADSANGLEIVVDGVKHLIRLSTPIP